MLTDDTLRKSAVLAGQREAAMTAIKRSTLRKIAENELVVCFGELDAGVRNDLATSLVRQWLTYEGNAGVVTATHQFWLRLITKRDGVDVGIARKEGNWGHILTKNWGVDKNDIPDLSHRLNLCQSALYRQADGRRLRIWIEPKERVVQCQQVTGQDE
jgi:hypothetical protein